MENTKNKFQLDESSSERLRLMRFPLMVAVVYIHAILIVPNRIPNGTNAEIYWQGYLRDFISYGVASIAVPCFFLISGYLFFLNYEGTIHEYREKLRSRIHTLLIPYLFWRNIVIIGYYVAQNISLFAPYFTGARPSVSSFGFFDYMDALLGVSASPFAFQFWYIRDLIVLSLLAPVFYVASRRAPILLFLAAVFYYYYCFHYYAWKIPRFDALFFFVCGAILAVQKRNIFCFDRYGLFAAILCFFVILADVLSMHTGKFIFFLNLIWKPIGVVAILWFSKILYNFVPIRKFFIRLSCASFFLFATHEPILTIFYRIIKSVTSEIFYEYSIMFYFLLPVIVITLVTIGYFLVNAIMPRALRIVCGGR